MESDIPPLIRFLTKYVLLTVVLAAWCIPLFTFGRAVTEVYAHPLSPEELLVQYQDQWKNLPDDDVAGKDAVHQKAMKLRWHLCYNGEHDYCPEPVPVAKNVDLDKLAYAVAVAETSNCRAGTGKSKNNCHGIFGRRANGDYGPRTFETTAQSFWEFKKLWIRKYGDRFPTLADAQRYSGGPGDSWLGRVTAAYNREVQY